METSGQPPAVTFTPAAAAPTGSTVPAVSTVASVQQPTRPDDRPFKPFFLPSNSPEPTFLPPTGSEFSSRPPAAPAVPSVSPLPTVRAEPFGSTQDRLVEARTPSLTLAGLEETWNRAGADKWVILRGELAGRELVDLLPAGAQVADLGSSFWLNGTVPTLSPGMVWNILQVQPERHLLAIAPNGPVALLREGELSVSTDEQGRKGTELYRQAAARARKVLLEADLKQIGLAPGIILGLEELFKRDDTLVSQVTGKVSFKVTADQTSPVDAVTLRPIGQDGAVLRRVPAVDLRMLYRVVRPTVSTAGLEEGVHAQDAGGSLSRLQEWLARPEVTGGKGIRARVLTGLGRQSYDALVVDQIPSGLVPELAGGLSPLLAHLNSQGSFTWADVAGGLGAAQMQAQMLFPNLSPVLVDALRWKRDQFDRAILNELEHQARQVDVDLWSRSPKFLEADAQSVDLRTAAESSLRLITMMNALAYNEDPLRILANLYNQLEPDGILVTNLYIPVNSTRAADLVKFYERLQGHLTLQGVAADFRIREDWSAMGAGEHNSLGESGPFFEHSVGIVLGKQRNQRLEVIRPPESEEVFVQNPTVRDVTYQVAWYGEDPAQAIRVVSDVPPASRSENLQLYERGDLERLEAGLEEVSTQTAPRWTAPVPAGVAAPAAVPASAGAVPAAVAVPRSAAVSPSATVTASAIGPSYTGTAPAGGLTRAPEAPAVTSTTQQAKPALIVSTAVFSAALQILSPEMRQPDGRSIPVMTVVESPDWIPAVYAQAEQVGLNLTQVVSLTEFGGSVDAALNYLWKESIRQGFEPVVARRITDLAGLEEVLGVARPETFRRVVEALIEAGLEQYP